MTLYRVKYGPVDWRVHRDDGSELGSWAERPDRGDILVASVTGRGRGDYYSTDEAVREQAAILDSEIVQRDVAEHGANEIPFAVPNDATLADGGPQRSD